MLVAIAFCVIWLFGTSISAQPVVDSSGPVAEQGQQPPPGQPPSPPPPPRPGEQPPPRAQQAERPPGPPSQPGQSFNIRVEITITDNQPSRPPVTKTVSMLVADGENGRIRAESRIKAAGEVPLHVDAAPRILSDARIRLRMSFAYDLPGDPTAAKEATWFEASKTSLQENLVLILDNGKPLVVSQSADPISDRKVTVEVRATILK